MARSDCGYADAGHSWQIKATLDQNEEDNMDEGMIIGILNAILYLDFLMTVLITCDLQWILDDESSISTTSLSCN